MDQDSLIWRLASSGYHGLVRTATPIANQCAARVRETIRSAVYGDEDDQGAQDGASVANRASSINSVVFAYESYIFSLQRILLWDRPYHSAAALIGFNCVYWLIISWTRRFFSVLFLACFLFHSYRLWTNYIWPEIRVPIPEELLSEEDWTPLHPQALTAPEVSHYITQCMDMILATVDWFVNLRKSNHGFFCILVSSIFILAALIGRVVPGVVVVYAILMTLALGPGVGLYVLPHGWYSGIRDLVRKNQVSQDVNYDDDDSDCLPNYALATRLNAEVMREVTGSSSQLNDRELAGAFDRELGIASSRNDDIDLPLKTSSGKPKDKSPHSSRASSEDSTGVMNFIPSYFASSKNPSIESNPEESTDDASVVDDFEILTDTEINSVDTANPATKSFLETNL